MFPELVLLPSSRAELVTLGVFAATALVAGAHGSFRRRADAAQAALLAAYLFGALAVILTAHATLGASPLVVSSYAATLVLGIAAAWAIVLPRLRAMGLPSRMVVTILLGCLMIGVVGARIAHVLSELLHAPHTDLGSALFDRRAGLGVYGAFVANLAFLVVLFRRSGHSLARALDASASAMALSIVVARVGCLLAGCCFGAPASSGWLTVEAAAFHPDSPAGATYSGTTNGAIWATQPLEAAAVLVLGVGCEALYRARARLGLRDGTIIVVLAVGYGAIRSVVEVLRADSPRVIGGVLTVWQMASGLTCAAAFAWWLRSRAPALPAD